MSYIPRLRSVCLDEAGIGLVLNEIGGKDRRSGRDVTVSFSVAEVNHALLVVSVKHSVVILVVGIYVTSGGRRNSIPIVHVSCAERQDRFRCFGESRVEHLKSHDELEV